MKPPDQETRLLFKTQFSFYSSSMNGNCILHGVLEGEIKLISCSKEVKKKKRANVLYIFKWFCIHKWFQPRRLKIPPWHVHFCLHIYIMMSWCNNLGSGNWFQKNTYKAGSVQLFPCSSMGLLPQKSVLHELLLWKSFPWDAAHQSEQALSMGVINPARILL